MHRFFLESNFVKEDRVVITGDDFNHISHSLRLNSGDEVIVNTGDSMDLLVELIEFSTDQVSGIIRDRYKNKNEPRVKITLAQAVPKNRNMDLIAQKCTEIGIYSIIPLDTERTVVKLSSRKEEKRVARWQRIVREAAKQSQRGRVPEVKNLHNIEDIADIKNRYDLVLVCWEEIEETGLKDILEDKDRNKIGDILVVIGPEGGLSKEEVNTIQGQNLSLGPRILRTETAGLVALTMILYEFGEMG